MQAKPIQTNEDYQQSIQQLEGLFDAAKGTKAGAELEALVSAIEKYEDEHYPIEPLLSKETIQLRKKQLDQ